jgi:hypothetical protein
MGAVDLIHYENFLPQCEVTLFGDIWTVFFYLELGNYLGGENTLYMVFYSDPVLFSTSLVRIDIIRLNLVITALLLVFEHRLIDDRLPALPNFLKELVFSSLKHAALLASGMHIIINSL